jgi:predicted anti-sigma-YlaC factor YlaD
MMDPIKILLPAYHDRQLSPQETARVETHLVNCPACQRELDELGSLSLLLRAAPGLTRAISPEVAAKRVVERLGPPEGGQPARAAWQGLLKASWHAFPLGMIGAWIFSQAVLVIAILLILSGTIRTLPQGAIDIPWVSSLPVWAGILIMESLERLVPASVEGIQLLQISVIQVALTCLIAVFMWGWLATWLVHRRQSFAARGA